MIPGIIKYNNEGKNNRGNGNIRQNIQAGQFENLTVQEIHHNRINQEKQCQHKKDQADNAVSDCLFLQLFVVLLLPGKFLKSALPDV